MCLRFFKRKYNLNDTFFVNKMILYIDGKLDRDGQMARRRTGALQLINQLSRGKFFVCCKQFIVY